MAGDFNRPIPHLLQGFFFGQFLSLFPVADIVLAVAGVFALPFTRRILVADPNVRRIFPLVGARHAPKTLALLQLFATLFATVFVSRLF
jgi:hypothetical protein